MRKESKMWNMGGRSEWSGQARQERATGYIAWTWTPTGKAGPMVLGKLKIKAKVKVKVGGAAVPSAAGNTQKGLKTLILLIKLMLTTTMLMQIQQMLEIPLQTGVAGS